MLNGRTYVVSSPELALAVQRNHKSLAFNPIMIEAIRRMVAFDDDAMAKIKRNLNNEEGKWGLMYDTHDMMYATLAPGPELDELNLAVLDQFVDTINKFDASGREIKLWAWLRHHFSLASTNALYGPQNPFAIHPELEEVFWDYETGLVALLIDFMPSITARKAYVSQQRLLAALVEYVEAGRHNEASKLIQRRIGINRRYGLSTKMQAHGELGMLFGSLVNSVPACFWLLVSIYTSPSLLSEIRAEIDHCVSVEGNEGKINVHRLKTECPLFASTYREVLRTTASINANRWVMEDTTIAAPDGKEYLLKKGGVVQVASGVIHASPSVWGPDSETFNPRRFLPTSSSTTAPSVTVKEPESDSTKPVGDRVAESGPSKRHHPAAFRAFGGGQHLCPGRHFAQTEILALVALFVAGFEISASERDGGGVVGAPRREENRIPLGIQKPVGDVGVVLRRRGGGRVGRWGFEM
ncbi:hypothetical protein LTR28_007757 [Elasticomyces elasticus]|nr:hypothetical protein LTR28_007757 [Elasticomyces elasticus]